MKQYEEGEPCEHPGCLQHISHPCEHPGCLQHISHPCEGCGRVGGITRNLAIYSRKKVTVNTDPQRRCYNGCHFSSEEVWTEWELFEPVTAENAERKLAFWRELNAYAVSQRGQSALTEYEVREE